MCLHLSAVFLSLAAISHLSGSAGTTGWCIVVAAALVMGSVLEDSFSKEEDDSL